MRPACALFNAARCRELIWVNGAARRVSDERCHGTDPGQRRGARPAL